MSVARGARSRLGCDDESEDGHEEDRGTHDETVGTQRMSES
jgi:hypothetical protein